MRTRTSAVVAAGSLALLVAGSWVTTLAYARPERSLLVSAGSGGAPANDAKSPGDAGAGIAITPNGRYVAFSSPSSNLDSNNTARFTQVYVKDMRTGALQDVTVAAAGRLLVGGGLNQCYTASDSGAASPVLSADGVRVAFTSCYLNLVVLAGPGEAALAAQPNQIYVRDRTSRRTILASVNDQGAPANGPVSASAMSADGRFVVFASDATNLVASSCPGDTTEYALCTSPVGPTLDGSRWQVYLRDLKKRRTTLISSGKATHRLTGSHSCRSSVPTVATSASPAMQRT